MDAQRAIVKRKIAAAEARTTAENARGAEAGEILASVLEDYFGTRLKPSALRCRTLDRLRVLSVSMRGGWFHFRRGETDIIVALDEALIAAAVNSALARPLAETNAASPTAIDRSIASALARRIAAALAPISAGASSAEIDLVQAGALGGDLKVDKAATDFELIEALGFSLAPSFRVNFLCAVSTRNEARKAPPGGLAPDWSADLSRLARGTEIALDARLGVAPTTIGAMIDLAPDMVLPIAGAAIDRLCLAARGQPQTVLVGKLGAHSGRRAVRIGA